MRRCPKIPMHGPPGFGVTFRKSLLVGGYAVACVLTFFGANALDRKCPALFTRALSEAALIRCDISHYLLEIHRPRTMSAGGADSKSTKFWSRLASHAGATKIVMPDQ